jgi:hypothetical protein
MFDLLSDAKEKMPSLGQFVVPVGNWGKPKFTSGMDKDGKPINDKLLIIEACESNLEYLVRNSTYTSSHGVLGPGTFTGSPSAPPTDSYIEDVDLKSIVEPEEDPVIYLIRMGLPTKSGIVFWPNYLPGEIRGGLAKPDWKKPKITSATLRFLGSTGSKQTSQEGVALPGQRYQFFMTYGKYPTFSFANTSPEYQKLILYLKIMKMRIKPVPEEEYKKNRALGVKPWYMFSETAYTLL